MLERGGEGGWGEEGNEALNAKGERMSKRINCTRWFFWDWHD